MIFGEVVGTVVSTVRSDTIAGARMLLVQICSHRGGLTDDYVVALDAVDAGRGERVLISQGSSARQMKETYQKPIDAVIIGIIDTIEEEGTVVYRK